MALQPRCLVECQEHREHFCLCLFINGLKGEAKNTHTQNCNVCRKMDS